MYISYPSGRPSPSVSDSRGSKYSLNPDSVSSGDLPVSERRSVKQVSKVHGQQYSINALAPSLSKSVILSEPFIGSRPSTTTTPKGESICLDSLKITSWISGIKSSSWSTAIGPEPGTSGGSTDDTGACGLVWETKTRLLKINNVTRNAVCFRRMV